MAVDNETHRRLRVLVPAFVIQLCLGTNYGWSVFVKPLMDLHGWSRSAATLPLSVGLVFNGLSYVLIGYWADHHPRRMTIVGGLMLGLGVTGAGLAAWKGLLLPTYVCYGVMGGIGGSFAYLSVLSAVIKWFPRRRGLAAGLVIMGCGLGPVLVGMVVPKLIEHFGPGRALVAMGLVMCLICGALGPMIDNPPRRSDQPPAPRPVSLLPWEVLRFKRFWGLWTIQAIAMIAAVGLFSQAAVLVQEVHGISAVSAGRLVATMALCNALGRVFWPPLSDRLGRRTVLVTLLLTEAAAFLALTHLPSLAIFWIVCSYIPLCYGGSSGTLPAFTADLFGPQNVGRMYGPIMSAQAVGGLLGPLMYSVLRDELGSYRWPTVLTGLVLLVAAALPLLMGRLQQPASDQNQPVPSGNR